MSEQDRGYGTELLKQGLSIAKEHGMSKVLLNIKLNWLSGQSSILDGCPVVILMLHIGGVKESYEKKR